MKEKNNKHCIICNRSLKQNKWANKGVIPICDTKHIQERTIALTNCFNSIGKIESFPFLNKIDFVNVSMDDSHDYISMFHNVSVKDPVTFINNIILLCHEQLKNAIEKYPFLKARTPIQALFEVPDSFSNENVNIKNAKVLVKNLHRAIVLNFNKHIEKCLFYENKTIIQSQISSIRELALNKIGPKRGVSNKDNFYASAKIKEVYGDTTLTKNDIKNIVSIIEEVTTLIPDKYKKNVPPLTLIIRDSSSVETSSASIAGKDSVLILKKHNNALMQAAEGLHEYLHLLEKFNLKIRKKSNEFLLSRILQNKKVSLREMKIVYGKKIKASANGVEVYPTDLIDPYAGRTYGNLGKNSTVHSEVLTVGAEAMFLAPYDLLLLDNEYFNFIKSIFLGEI